MKKNKNRKSGKGHATRKRILREAIGMISRRGPDAVSMESIAVRLGLTKPLIYYYFKSKDALIRKVFEETSREAGEDWTGNLGSPATLEALARGIFSRRRAFFTSKPEAARCLLRLYSAPEGTALRRMADARIARHAGALKTAMNALVSGGRLPAAAAADATLLIRAVMALMLFEFQHSGFTRFPDDFHERMAGRLSAAFSA